MAIPMLDCETILRAIQIWPQGEQVALAQDILTRVGTPMVDAQFKRTVGSARFA